jgi:hypothetical protein
MICPYCRHNCGPPMNAFTKQGQLFICPDCGEIAIVDGALELRLPTEDEAAQIRKDPQVVLIEFAMKMRAGERRRQ